MTPKIRRTLLLASYALIGFSLGRLYSKNVLEIWQMVIISIVVLILILASWEK